MSARLPVHPTLGHDRPAAPALDPARGVERIEPDTTVERVAALRDEGERQLVARIHDRFVRESGTAPRERDPSAVREALDELLQQVSVESGVVITRQDRARLLDALIAETVGYGPIDQLISDDRISEVMVNGCGQVWIEREGRLALTDIRFADDAHVMRVIQRIVSRVGRRCDEASPMVDARLPDGSRVNAIIPPLSLVGPILTIRKFKHVPFGPRDLLAMGVLTHDALDLLAACVRGRLNVVVAGGSGSGKTTLLNTLSSFISGSERIVTIEDAAELHLLQRHVLRLEARPPNVEGRGEVTIRDLFRNSLRMRPDRIIIGEARGGEAVDMLQAMNTGHDGSLTTVHANSPRDALYRIEAMVLMSGVDMPLRAVREQIASAIDLVVFVERMANGGRKVTKISEVRAMEGDVVTMQDLFVWSAGSAERRGSLRSAGVRPEFAEELAQRGIQMRPEWFGSEPDA